MTNDAVTLLTMGGTPVLLAVFAWITGRRINNRTSEDSRLETRLSQQRADFDSLIKPLQATVTDLYARVGKLEDRATRAESNTRTLAQGLRDTLEYLDDHYQDKGPDLPAKVHELLERT